MAAAVAVPGAGVSPMPSSGGSMGACSPPATSGLLAALRPERDGEVVWRVEQGVDMDRPSLLLGRTEKRGGLVTGVHVAGHAVPVMHGLMNIPQPGDEPR